MTTDWACRQKYSSGRVRMMDWVIIMNSDGRDPILLIIDGGEEAIVV